MEFADYLAIVRKRWLSVVVVALAVLSVSALLTLVVTPKYTAVARMFFSVQGGESISDLTQGSTFTEKQMSSYAEVATSPIVIGAVVRDLQLSQTPSEVASAIDVTIPVNTVILEVSASDPDAARAADLANAVSTQLATTVGELSPDRPDGSESVKATVLTPAEAPPTPAFPNPKLNVALGATLGLAFGLAVAIVRELLDTKVRRQEDLAKVTDAPVIGNVVYAERGAQDPLFMHTDPSGARAESIRRLRTNLQFVDLSDKPNSIVVTSSVPGEGKTTTTLNLAISMSDAGARVILVDADLRRPSVGAYMGLESRAGLTTVLIGRASLADVVQPWKNSSLDVLASGQIPPNPSELLGSRAMHALLAELTQTYDIVLIDSPPLLPVTDAAILSRMAGGAVVVAGSDRIHKAQLAQTLQALEKVSARTLGIVLNKVERAEQERYSYHSYSAAERDARELRSPSRPKNATWPGRPLADS